jgi:hypothetical protein
MNNQNPRTAKYIAVVLVLVVIAFLGALGLTVTRSITERGNFAIEVIAVPRDAKITIDGRAAKTGKQSLPPGQHTFEATKDGFAVATKQQVIVDGDRITLLLTPKSQAAQEYAEKNLNLYLEAEGVAGTETRLEGESFRRNNPILSVLPYRGGLFTIEYRLSKTDPNRAVVQINAASSEARSFAIDRIRSMGYEPSDYEIEFTNLPSSLVIEANNEK